MGTRRQLLSGTIMAAAGLMALAGATQAASARNVEDILKKLPEQAGKWEGPPIAPHANEWTAEVNEFSQGAPWVKVLYSHVVPAAKKTGAKVFLRPWDQSTGPDGDPKAGGVKMASDVLKNLSRFPKEDWPDAISFQNEFNNVDEQTAQAFLDYYDTLRKGGYEGLIIYGSYGPGGPTDITEWERPHIRKCVEKADGIETHEYWDLTVRHSNTWLAHRHVRMMEMYPELKTKPWFIGEFGSDGVNQKEDPMARSGWNDRGKLTVDEYIRQIKIYRSGDRATGVVPPAKQVQAVFLYQQGAVMGWEAWEVLGTPVADYMQTTWTLTTGTIRGFVTDQNGKPVEDAEIVCWPGGETVKSDKEGRWWFFALPSREYTLKAIKPGMKSSDLHKVGISGGDMKRVDLKVTRG